MSQLSFTDKIRPFLFWFFPIPLISGLINIIISKIAARYIVLSANHPIYQSKLNLENNFSVLNSKINQILERYYTSKPMPKVEKINKNNHYKMRCIEYYRNDIKNFRSIIYISSSKNNVEVEHNYFLHNFKYINLPPDCNYLIHLFNNDIPDDKEKAKDRAIHYITNYIASKDILLLSDKKDYTLACEIKKSLDQIADNVQKGQDQRKSMDKTITILEDTIYSKCAKKPEFSYELNNISVFNQKQEEVAKLDILKITPDDPDLYIIRLNGNVGNLFDDLQIKELITIANRTEACVIGFNYRGIGYNKWKPRNANDLRRDAKAVVENLLGQGISADKIVLLGTSLGGSLACEIAAELHKEGKKINLFADQPFSSITEVITARIPLISAIFRPIIKYFMYVTNWEIDASSAYKIIPNEYKDYTVLKNDEVIPHSASLHKAVKECKGTITPDNERKERNNKHKFDGNHGYILESLSQKSNNVLSGMQYFLDFLNQIRIRNSSKKAQLTSEITLSEKEMHNIEKLSKKFSDLPPYQKAAIIGGLVGLTVGMIACAALIFSCPIFLAITCGLTLIALGSSMTAGAVTGIGAAFIAGTTITTGATLAAGGCAAMGTKAAEGINWVATMKKREATKEALGTVDGALFIHEKQNCN